MDALFHGTSVGFITFLPKIGSQCTNKSKGACNFSFWKAKEQYIRRGRKSFARRDLHVVSATVAPPTIPGSSSAEEFDKGREAEEESGKFIWRDHWYPVSLIEDLDPKIPTPFQLLGREIVLWQDAEGNWKAFEDKCPHRLAPLSEGRLDENGWLQCSYHGWSFKADGSCARIPQAASEGPEARAVRSPRACAVSFPTTVSQGLLFVWPDENGWERASKFKPPLLPDAFSDPCFSTVTIQRDLFYGYDTLMENVSDPSHIDFAHHKVTGRRDRAKPLTFKVDSSGPWGFSGSNSETPKISASFIAPCYYINKIEIPVKLPLLGEQTWEIWICSFNTPMLPGKTRSIVCSARNFFRFTMPGPAWWQGRSIRIVCGKSIRAWEKSQIDQLTPRFKAIQDSATFNPKFCIKGRQRLASLSVKSEELEEKLAKNNCSLHLKASITSKSNFKEAISTFGTTTNLIFAVGLGALKNSYFEDFIHKLCCQFLRRGLSLFLRFLFVVGPSFWAAFLKVVFLTCNQ